MLSQTEERWAEHYQELYSRENIVSNAAIESTNALKSTQPEVVKAGKSTALLHHLHELLLQCWEEGTIPQDMRDANIITL